MRDRLALTVVLVLALSLASAEAQMPKFVEIANLGMNPVLGTDLSINDHGEVAFHALIGTGAALFVGDGRQLRQLVTTGGKFLFLGGGVSINNSGAVAFRGVGSDGIHRLFRYASGQVEQVNVGVPECCGDFAMNDQGVVVFTGGPRPQPVGSYRTLFKSDGKDVTAIASPANGFSGIDFPSINNAGVVVFRGFGENLLHGIYVADGRTVETIADTAGPLCSVGAPDINSQGTIVYEGWYPDCTEGPITIGIFTVSRLGESLIAETGSEFENIMGSMLINDRGDVIMRASRTPSEEAIFLGPYPWERIVAIGDLIDGRTVLGIVPIAKPNNRGDVAFLGMFSDGSHRIYRIENTRAR